MATNSQEQPQLSAQIAVYKTNKKLIEILDKLNPATVGSYAHLHADHMREDGSRQYSLLGLVLLDYSKGTGDKTVRVSANVTSEDLAYILSQLQQGKDEINFVQEKIFGSVDGVPNGGRVTKTAFRRMSVGQDGKPRNYPWYVEVQNGTALKGSAPTGGTFIQPNSYQMEAKVGINLNDHDMFALLYKVMRYVNIWEAAYGTQLLRQAIQVRRLQHQNNKEA